MATNNFKAFALDPNANVTPQANWEALPALLSGFTAGKASSAQVNKALRQATTIAALVGQFIANSGVDALDNADVNGLVTKFTNALTTNLSLGTASKKNVGSGTGQIPDMSSFPAGLSDYGYMKLPNGFMLQWRTLTIGPATAGTMRTSSAGWAATFPTAVLGAVCSLANVTTYDTTKTGFVSSSVTTTGFTIGSGYTASNSTVTIFALGY